MKMILSANPQRFPSLTALTAIIAAAFIGLSGCEATMPKMGGASGHTVTGAAGGETAEGENSALERCDETLGTLSVVEDQSAPWWASYRHRYPTLGTTVPVLRMMIQQSNCFVVVERGKAMNNMMQERALMQSGEMRQGSNFGKGQMVAADYTMNPSIQFSEKGTGGVKAVVGGLLSSTFITLILIPTMYFVLESRLHRKKK